MISPILKMLTITLIPVAVTVLCWILDNKTAFKKLSYWPKQIVFGILFGAVAVAGTEFGIHFADYTVNVRDSAPLAAGFLFGGPAGIIAALIGGIERWFSVYWGGGVFTREACTISTILFGFTTAAIKKFIVADSKRNIGFATLTAAVCEVFHMLMVFITNFSQMRKSGEIIQSCSIPMIICVSLAVFLSCLAFRLLDKTEKDNGLASIPAIVQKQLFYCIFIMFILTNVLTNYIQAGLANEKTEEDMKSSISDVKIGINEASDNNILRLAFLVAEILERNDDYTYVDLKGICSEMDLSEINIINKKGIIKYSSNPLFLDFSMESGEQSKEFLTLLNPKPSMKTSGRYCYVQEYQSISYDKNVKMKYAAVTLNNGFLVQIGYNGKKFESDLLDYIKMNAHSHHPEDNSGNILIFDDFGNFVCDSQQTEKIFRNSSLPIRIFEIERQFSEFRDIKKVAKRIIDGESYLVLSDWAEGYYIVSTVPTKTAYKIPGITLFLVAFCQAFSFFVSYLLIYLLIKLLIINSLEKINGALNEITEGHLDIKMEHQKNREFENLSRNINKTVDTLKGYISEAAARIDKELEVARTIQASSLPQQFFDGNGYVPLELHATMDTAKEVGGDFYDFYFIDENHVAFLIADVSGKGITAAMFMMKAKAIIKSMCQKYKDAAKALEEANNALCEGNDAEMFVTVWLGILDIHTGIIKFSSAGHNPAIIIKNGEKAEYLRIKNSLVLGGMDGIPYRENEVALEKDDVLYLYTDGITEAQIKTGELYGEDRLLECINGIDLKKASMKEMLFKVAENVKEFEHGEPQFDDKTMLSIRFGGKK